MVVKTSIGWLRFSKPLQSNGYYSFIYKFRLTAESMVQYWICKVFSNTIRTMDIVLIYNGRNSPESLQAYDLALGGYIIQVKISSSMQVPCRCKHAPWHLGANASRFSSHHIIQITGLSQEDESSFYFFLSHSPVLSYWAGTWGLHIAPQFYMIRSTKVPAHYCIMTRPLGATLVEVFMSIMQLQVPGCCKHGNPALGGYRWYAYKGETIFKFSVWSRPD